MEYGVLINDSFHYDVRGAFLFCISKEDNIDIYFLNNINDELIIDIKPSVRAFEYDRIKFKAIPQSLYFLAEYPLDILNEGLKFDFNILNKQITESRYEEIIKLRPKKFITNQEYIMDFSAQGHIIKLFDEFPEIDKEQIKYINEEYIENSSFDNYIDTSVKINVTGNEKEIDLHIENICTNHAKMKSVEILNFQINYFLKELDDALINGLEKLTVCHGIGKGVLKSKIHEILLASNDVKSFKNEYHHKFGFGSTEIFLK